jgi:hypothetical protein
MKNAITSALIAVTLFLIIVLCTQVNDNRIEYVSNTDLELYIGSHVYYINGFVLTEEGNEDVIIFKSSAEMKAYILELSKIPPYFECEGFSQETLVRKNSSKLLIE